MRGKIVTLAAVAATFTAPGVASAANYFASDGGTGDCSSAAQRCSLATALGLINDNPDVDDLDLAAGTYDDANQDLLLQGPNFEGLTIHGAGRGQTILKPTVLNTPFRFGGGTFVGTTTIRDLTLSSENVAGADDNTIVTQGTVVLQDVDVIADGGETGIVGATNNAATTSLTLRRVNVEHRADNGIGSFSAVDFSSSISQPKGSLLVEDSSIDVRDDDTGSHGIFVSGFTDTTVRRSAVRLRRTGSAQASTAIFVWPNKPTSDAMSATIEDNVVLGGLRGIFVDSNGPFPLTASVARNSIDAGTIGTADQATTVISPMGIGVQTEPGESINATVRDNVVIDGLYTATGGTLTYTCGTNLVMNPANNALAGATSCPTNVTGGTIADSFPVLGPNLAWSALFSPGQAGIEAFSPQAGAKHLDKGSGNGAPADDLAGAPRIVDADDADCVAQMDIGAYEAQGLENDCSTPPPGGGGGGTTPPPGGGGGGGIPQIKPPVTVLPTALTLSGASVSPKRPKRASAAKATLTFTLNRAGTIAAKLERRDPGRRSGKKCVKPTSRNRKAKACKRYVRITAKSLAGKAGKNSVTLKAVIGSRKLKKGTYRLTLTPAGGKAATVSMSVR